MSDRYAESNSEHIIELFYKRQIYLRHANNDRYYGSDDPDQSNLIDFNHAEKFLYGRVDRYYVPIILNTTETPLTSIAASADTAVSIQAPAYVAEAFKDLSLQFQKAAMAKKISSSQKYLTALTPHKAYKDPQMAYYDHSVSVENAMAEFYTEHNIKFKNFDEFVTHFMASLRRVAHQLPITFPAFVKSRLCPISCSGLAIEIADLSFSNDLEKMLSFVKSPNWAFYLNACRTYGFSVDRRNPFRIVADIGSTQMIEYANKYNFGSTDKILMLGYSPAHLGFYNAFKDFLLKFYNKLKAPAYIEIEYCQNSPTIQRFVSPIKYTAGDLQKKYGEPFFLDIYFEIRFMEEESVFSNEDRKRIINHCLDLHRITGYVEALSIFEKILNQTYDYSGSLTDYIRRVTIGIEAE